MKECKLDIPKSALGIQVPCSPPKPDEDCLAASVRGSEFEMENRKIYLDLPTTDDGKLTLYCKFHSLCPEPALVNYRGLSFHIYLFWKFSVSIKIDGKSLPASGMNINRCFDYPLDSSNHSHRCSPRSTGESFVFHPPFIGPNGHGPLPSRATKLTLVPAGAKWE